MRVKCELDVHILKVFFFSPLFNKVLIKFKMNQGKQGNQSVSQSVYTGQPRRDSAAGCQRPSKEGRGRVGTHQVSLPGRVTQVLNEQTGEVISDNEQFKENGTVMRQRLPAAGAPGPG